MKESKRHKKVTAFCQERYATKYGDKIANKLMKAIEEIHNCAVEIAIQINKLPKEAHEDGEDVYMARLAIVFMLDRIWKSPSIKADFLLDLCEKYIKKMKGEQNDLH